MERKVIVIAGPTCSGKTSAGISLCERIRSEIISADSRQIYKQLDIGTAKPTSDELKSVKHHFINLLDPNEEYNVSRFEKEALEKINLLLGKSKIPVVVGGSGLYIRALIDGIFDSVDPDSDYRAELLALKEKFGNEALYEKLKNADPVSASKMLPQNWKRVIRALEVFNSIGEPIWKAQEKEKKISDIKFYQFGLEWERELLYKNIESRVDEMIESGLIAEVEKILNSGYSKKLNSLNTVGYKEIISYLENEITFERAVELIKRNTRRYAKRQLTWFRKDNRINWIKVTSRNDLEKVPEFILKNFN